MEFTTAGNLEGIWGIRILNTHGHVCFHFFIQAFTNMAACDEIPFLTGKRTVVDRKGHGQGRFVNFDASELFRIFRISNGIADFNILQPYESNDFPGFGFLGLDPFQAFIGIQTANFFIGPLIVVHQIIWPFLMVPRTIRPTTMRPT